MNKVHWSEVPKLNVATMYTDARAGNQSGMQHKKQDVLHQVQKGNGVTKPTGMGVHTGDPRATNNFQVQEENAK